MCDCPVEGCNPSVPKIQNTNTSDSMIKMAVRWSQIRDRNSCRQKNKMSLALCMFSKRALSHCAIATLSFNVWHGLM